MIIYKIKHIPTGLYHKHLQEFDKKGKEYFDIYFVEKTLKNIKIANKYGIKYRFSLDNNDILQEVGDIKDYVIETYQMIYNSTLFLDDDGRIASCFQYEVSK